MNGKRVLIVGGSSGIGFSLANLLINCGAEVVIASRSLSNLENAQQLLGGSVEIFRVDASASDELSHFFGSAGQFDHLVSTIKPAHVNSSFITATPEAMQSSFDCKFWGQLNLARYGAGSLRAGGSIIFTSGIAASRGYPGFALTAATNGAVESLARALAVELAPIRVNVVSPGFIERFSDDKERLAHVRSLGARIPLSRLGTQTEVAKAYRYLMENAYVTGEVLHVDGGELSA